MLKNFCDFRDFRVRYPTPDPSPARGGEGCVCQKFSQGDAFWRRFLGAVGLVSTEGGKWAYFEWPLGIKGLGRGVLKRGVKKVSGRHGMPTNGTKKEVES